MNSRLELHEVLCSLLGSRNVYYQAPESYKISYPAIVYERADIDNAYADNSVFRQAFKYKITYISDDPDDSVIFAISKLRTCKYIQHYVYDNLNHEVFTIYY